MSSPPKPSISTSTSPTVQPIIVPTNTTIPATTPLVEAAAAAATPITCLYPLLPPPSSSSSPAPAAPPRKKHRAPPPPLPANVTQPPISLPTTTLPYNVLAPSIPAQATTTTTTTGSHQTVQTLPEAVLSVVTALIMSPTATPVTSAPNTVTPPSTNVQALPTNSVTPIMPSASNAATPPPPQITPSAPIPMVTPPNVTPPAVVTTATVSAVPSTLPISTKTPPPTPVVQPSSPTSIASYLSLASVALGKIPNTPLPIVVPTPVPTAAATVLPTGSKTVRQNLVGFEDGNWYKIRNVGDNSVVQLDEDGGGKFICMEENADKSDLQLFRAIEQPNSSYRIMSKMQKSSESIQVWDYLPHRGLLHQKKQSEKTDKYQQNWKSSAVPNFNSLYLIQSGPNPETQNCLKNTGIGEQIKLITKDDAAAIDHFAHWYLELQE